MHRPVVLVVDDESAVRATLEAVLKPSYDVVAVPNAADAVAAVKSRAIDMVLMDVNLPGMDGIRALELIRELDADVGVVMLSGVDSAHQAVQAIKKGAYDYITKPFDGDDLLLTLNRYVYRQGLKNEVAYLREELKAKFGYGEIVSRSPKMKAVFDLIGKVGKTTSSVLITGESGTGKELVARAIQAAGERRSRPFVAVNCGAVPSELMESELFGHEKGAFTSAHARKIGRFEYADGGTIFFDEVSTLPPSLQIKLLRVLQEKQFERVGSNVPVKVDIRVIAATNVNLSEAVRRGAFREDLFYRLNVVPINLPPLRERREDIPLLVQHFVEKHRKSCNKPFAGITREAIDALSGYGWPGNVRELENLVERLIVVSREGHEIGVEDLPIVRMDREPADEADAAVRGLHEACRAFERRYIAGVLGRTNWNRGRAAAILNIHRNTLLTKMKELGIKGPDKGEADRPLTGKRSA